VSIGSDRCKQTVFVTLTLVNVTLQATGWLRGKVKEVVSGDTVVVVAATQGPAVPPEKRLTLSSLVAPRLVSAGA
jgi:hypothetical protein